MMGFKDIGPDEFKKGLEKNPNAELIDVRTPEEYEDLHLKGAKLMNIMSPDFVQKVEQLPKDKAYYLYCRSGSRSASACQYMAGRGFSQLYNLQGGIMFWPYETE